MTPLATIAKRNPEARSAHPAIPAHPSRPYRRSAPQAAPAARLFARQARPAARSSPTGRETHGQPHQFTPLIDAKAASGLLGVPYTWLLAQAREGRIPHHRLGHYVRFNPEDLRDWLRKPS